MLRNRLGIMQNLFKSTTLKGTLTKSLTTISLIYKEWCDILYSWTSYYQVKNGVIISCILGLVTLSHNYQS